MHRSGLFSYLRPYTECMENTIYLSQVFGLFLIIGGASIMYRNSYFVGVIGGFVEERLMRMFIGMAELLGGLFLVLAHSDWSTLPAAIITAFGWMLVIEGTCYLLLPDSAIRWIIRTCNVKAWYIGGGAAAIAAGAYLAAFGFGLL